MVASIQREDCDRGARYRRIFSSSVLKFYPHSFVKGRTEEFQGHEDQSLGSYRITSHVPDDLMIFREASVTILEITKHILDIYSSWSWR